MGRPVLSNFTYQADSADNFIYLIEAAAWLMNAYIHTYKSISWQVTLSYRESMQRSEIYTPVYLPHHNHSSVPMYILHFWNISCYCSCNCPRSLTYSLLFMPRFRFPFLNDWFTTINSVYDENVNNSQISIDFACKSVSKWNPSCPYLLKNNGNL